MIQVLTLENFRPYGRLIQYSGKEKKGRTRNLFRIVLRETGRFGWRIAYLVVRDTTIKRLECHPHSHESFEPVRGDALLYVARKPDGKSIKCFRLDRPVIVHKGIWHGVVTSGKEAEIKLTENANVTCVYWPLGFSLDASNVQTLKTRKGYDKIRNG